jgi:CRISPR-associated protein Csb1
MTDPIELTVEEKEELTKFDKWVEDGGPAALVIRELLEPVEGPDGVFFPATFAAEQGNAPDRFRGGYNIDYFPDGTNVCLVDSVGSQANRIEPIFARSKYAGLVPQVNIKVGDKKTINLLQAGHRGADTIVRCTELKDELEKAFKESLKGNAGPLARIAPTSVVFGVWDSRGTQEKLPRLVSSTIRAFNVHPHTRHAQYNPVIRYKNERLLEGIDATDEELAQKGYVDQPIGRQPDPKKPDPTHGGVQLMRGEKIQGSIRRDTTLSLAALRRLCAADGGTKKLRRYMLGLALVAVTAEQETYLRQGCNLVPADAGKGRTFEIVLCCGKRQRVFHDQESAQRFESANPNEPVPFVLSLALLLTYANAAAKDFGIDPGRNVTSNTLPDWEVQFSSELAEKDIKGETRKLTGEVTSHDATKKEFILKVGKKGKQEEMTIVTNDSTAFLKAKGKSTFGEVVAQGAKLDVEVAGSVAINVTAKK